MLNHQTSALNHCALQEIFLQDQWISLRASNIFIFALKNTTTSLLICDGITKSLSLNGSGLIEFSKPCTLKLPNIIISGRVKTNISMQNSFVPSLKISEAIKPTNLFKCKDFSEFSKNSTNYVGVEKLRNKVNEVVKELDQDSNQSNVMNLHDYHHYEMNFIFSIMIIGTIIFYCLKKRKTQPPPWAHACRFEVDTSF